MPLRFSTLILLVVLIISFSSLTADDGGLIAENSAGNFYGIGARAMGMGGAHIAAVLDGTALIYNPAALAKIRRIELLGSISHQKFENSSTPGLEYHPIAGENNRSQNNTRLNSLIISVPYPTYRGSLVMSFGLNRVKSFDKTFKVGYTDGENDEYFLNGTEIETGSLYALSAGLGTDISPRISIGAALNYYFGTDDYEWRLNYGDTIEQTENHIHDNIEDKYSAVSAKVGILITPGRMFKFGLSIESPLKYSIDEKYVLRSSDATSDDPFLDIGDYSYELGVPFSFGFGGSINFNRLQIAADITYNQWTQMEYKDDLLLAGDNYAIQRFYDDILTVAVGAEYLIPRLGLKLRAGYLSDPIPFRHRSGVTYEPADNGFQVYDDRDFITFGAGYLFDRIMTVDIAFMIGSYSYTDVSTLIDEKVDLSRMYVTFGLRL